MLAGVPLYSALLEWHERVEAEVACELIRLRNRMELGQPAPAAIDGLRGCLATDRYALGCLISVLQRSGGDAAKAIDSLADLAQSRRGARAEAQAHVSGARLSARLVAALPLAFVPVAPLSGAPLGDATGIALLVLGLGLGVVGLAWVSALFPRPEPNDDPVAVLAEIVASAVEGGDTPASLLREVCLRPPPGLEDDLRRVGRLLRLGVAWHEALGRSGSDDLASVGRSARTFVALGLPLAGGLRTFASARRADRHRKFEAAVRRAPVRMAVPLTVCVLPSFVILGIGPFLRGLSLGV